MSRPVDVQRIRSWQESVARDPGDPAFLPLAEVYRREGRLDVAIRLCLRGLERNPEYVEAHFVLGRMYRERGDLEQAFDEWDIALRLDPAHRASRRELGLLCVEREEWLRAIPHLERAAAVAPKDERVARALALARRHAEGRGPSTPEAELLAWRQALERFVRESRVRLAMLLNGSGRILLQHGFSAELDLAAFASLSAGIHAASGALAQLMGERGFSQLYQGRGEHQLFMGPVDVLGGEVLLLTVFGEETTIGLVRVCFRDLLAEVSSLTSGALAPGARVNAAGFEAELAAGLRRARGSGEPTGSMR